MKNIRKHKILAWILAAVLMITSCPASVFADVIPTESGSEQQAVLTEGEPESSESVIEEAPAESTDENQAAEADSSQSEDVGSETVQENQEGSEQVESEQAEAPKEEQAAPKEEQTASKEESAKAKDATDSGKASAAKAPAAKTDSSAEKKDEAEEEEGREAPLVGKEGSIALDSMTTSMTASATPSSNVGRGDEISLRIGFTLDNDRVSEAATYEYWTYDLSAVVGEGQTILSLNDGDTGNLYEGSSVRGYYVVDGTMLKLFVDEEWLNSGLQNVSGTFNLSAKLNEEKNQSQDEATIPLPGTTGVKITFEDRTLNSTKKVGVTADALSEKNDGGIVQVIDNGDGTYTLYYSISVKPNTDQSKLSVSDLLGGGQMLNVESLKLNGQPADFAIAQYGNGFMLDLGPTKRDTEYVITYSTTISSEELGKNQTNEATWSWDGEQQKDRDDQHDDHQRCVQGAHADAARGCALLFHVCPCHSATSSI